MSGTKFVAIIPGAVEDLGAEHNLSGNAQAMLLWLAVTVDRETGIVAPATIKAVAEATRWSWRAVNRALDELEEAGGIETHLPKGHDGNITIVKEWHDQIVWKKGSRNRASTLGNRGSTRRNRASAIGNRASSIGNRASAVANRDDADKRERRTESSSNSLSGVASSAAPPLEGAGGDGAARGCVYCHGLPIDPPCNHCRWRPIDDRVSGLQLALLDLEEADGWGDDGEGPYADPFDDELTRVGYWTTSEISTDPNENLSPAELRQVTKVCDELDAWLAGTLLLAWMPGRSLGPQANGNTPWRPTDTYPSHRRSVTSAAQDP
jgi:hypothetical protein